MERKGKDKHRANRLRRMIEEEALKRGKLARHLSERGPGSLWSRGRKRPDNKGRERGAEQSEIERYSGKGEGHALRSRSRPGKKKGGASVQREKGGRKPTHFNLQ